MGNSFYFLSLQIAEEISLLNLEAENVDDIRFHDWYNRDEDEYAFMRRM